MMNTSTSSAINIGIFCTGGVEDIKEDKLKEVKQ
jgi:hypothetical protein